MYVLTSPGPEIRGPWRDELWHGEEPAVAKEKETQGILCCCGLQQLQGRDWDPAAGQYGHYIWNWSLTEKKKANQLTQKKSNPLMINLRLLMADWNTAGTVFIDQFLPFNTENLLLCYDSGLDLS